MSFDKDYIVLKEGECYMDISTIVIADIEAKGCHGSSEITTCSKSVPEQL
jgi:hypothetical protein